MRSRRAEQAFSTWVARSSDARLERVVGTRPALRVAFGAMASRYVPSAAPAEGFAGDLVFLLRPSSGPERAWTVRVAGGAASAVAGRSPSPALVVKLSVADFARLAAGELDPGGALLSGRLDLEGDFVLATRLGAMFGRPG